MTDLLPQPCARWADLLAAPPDDLSLEARRALDAHVASCQACVAVRADYQRMDTRIRSLPDPRTRPDLPPWLLALQAAAGRDAPASHQMIPIHSTEKRMQTRKEPGRVVPAPDSITQGHLLRRRVVSWVSAVAALVVIAVLTTAVLVSHSGKPSGAGNQSNTASNSPGSKGWNSPPGLVHISAQPFIAPSNPRVVYLLGSKPISLKRSDDSGAHWENLSLPPQASQAEYAVLEINTGDAQNVFLTLTFPLAASACSGNQASTGQVNAYSGYSCQLSRYSTDGGSHWGLMHWSAQAGVSGAVGSGGEIIAQGNHLYSWIYDRNQQQRLITSADEGATWQFADEALRTQGEGLCSFAAAPTGSAVFAFVQSGYCSQAKGYLHSDVTHPQAGSGPAIWRSDDAGAHWLQVGRFLYQQPDTSAFMAVDTGGAQPTLLAAAGQGATYTRLVSTDGGKTWQQLPTSLNNLASSQTTLSDGSILMTGQTPGSIFAWKPGSQSWRQIASPFTGNPIELVVSPSANGQQTLWLVTDYKGSFSVLYCTIK